MNFTVNRDDFISRLKDFRPTTHIPERTLAMYSASVALADDRAMSEVIALGRASGVTAEMFYEIVLQSYLFLGFPRMLGAAETLNTIFPTEHDGFKLEQINSSESGEWFDRGVKLCREVYADKYDNLMGRVASMAPEVFRWMIIEGYGKVLSRSGLDIVSRELSIIAFLMMENREKQLQSHIMGALNVGAPVSLVRTVIEDIGLSSGKGYKTSTDVLTRLGK